MIDGHFCAKPFIWHSYNQVVCKCIVRIEDPSPTLKDQIKRVRKEGLALLCHMKGHFSVICCHIHFLLGQNIYCGLVVENTLRITNNMAVISFYRYLCVFSFWPTLDQCTVCLLRKPLFKLFYYSHTHTHLTRTLPSLIYDARLYMM